MQQVRQCKNYEAGVLQMPPAEQWYVCLCVSIRNLPILERRQVDTAHAEEKSRDAVGGYTELMERVSMHAVDCLSD